MTQHYDWGYAGDVTRVGGSPSRAARRPPAPGLRVYQRPCFKTYVAPPKAAPASVLRHSRSAKHKHSKKKRRKCRKRAKLLPLWINIRPKSGLRWGRRRRTYGSAPRRLAPIIAVALALMSVERGSHSQEEEPQAQRGFQDRPVSGHRRADRDTVESRMTPSSWAGRSATGRRT